MKIQTAKIGTTSNPLYYSHYFTDDLATYGGGTLFIPEIATVTFKGLNKTELNHARAKAIVDFKGLYLIGVTMRDTKCSYKEAIKKVYWKSK